MSAERRGRSPIQFGSVNVPGTSDDGRQQKRKWMKDRLGTGLSDSAKVTTALTCTQTSAVIRIVSLSAALMDCDLSAAT